MKSKEHTWPPDIRNGLGFKLSHLGKRFSINALSYNPVVIELFHSYALQNAAKVVSAIREVFPGVRSAVVVGCGSGAFAADFNREGVVTLGLEYSRHGISLARQQGVDCRHFDVAKPVAAQIHETADLVYSFEVAEHVPASLADKIRAFHDLPRTTRSLYCYSARARRNRSCQRAASRLLDREVRESEFPPVHC